MRIALAVGVLAVLGGLFISGTAFWLTRAATTTAHKSYCHADCQAEKNLREFWNTNAEASGSSLRMVSASCSQKSKTGFYCIGLMGGAGGRFCAEFAVFSRGRRVQVDAASRMPYCPGEG